MDPYFSGHALVPKAQIVCIEVLEAISESNLSFVLPSVVEPVEESDEESIEETSSDEDEMDVTKGDEDRLTVHDITGQNFLQSYPESNSYLVDSGYASDEEDNDEGRPQNINNNNNNAEMTTSETSMSESDSDSHPHRYKHEHEKKMDQPRHHVKRTMKEEIYFEDSSRQKKRSKTEKSTTSVKWDWNQNKFV